MRVRDFRRGETPRTASLLMAAVLTLPPVAPAQAHPHVWVEVQTTIEADRGTFTAVRQRWTFDEFYSVMAIEGLDTNKDGVLDRSELAELAKVNMEGLKEFNYFTAATLGGQRLAFDEPKDAILEHVAIEAPPGPSMEPLDGAPKDQQASKNGQSGSFWSRAWDSLLGKGDPPPPQKPKVLVLEFILPLQQPVLTEAEGFQVATYDPSFFIWFDLAKKDAARIAGAPAGCVAEVRDGDKDAGDVQRLGEAFFNQAGGGNQMGGGPNVGGSVAKSITVRCAKS